jgi:hypothetical protein
MLSYLEQLRDYAAAKRVKLLDAVIDAGLPDSTYYRWNAGTAEPRREKAEAVKRAIDRLAQTT